MLTEGFLFLERGGLGWRVFRPVDLAALKIV